MSLLSPVKTVESLPSDIETKINKANSYKDEGNEFYKNNQYKKAISTYGKSLAYIRGLPGNSKGLEGYGALAIEKSKSNGQQIASENEIIRATDIEIIVHTNIATCYNKLSDFRKAIEHSDKALALNSSTWKAHLRKAEALIGLKHFDNADENLQQALRLCNDITWQNKIKNEQIKLIQLVKLEDNKQKKIFAGIFDKANAIDK